VDHVNNVSSGGSTMNTDSVNLLNLGAMMLSSRSSSALDKQMLKLKADDLNAKQIQYLTVPDNGTLITGDQMLSSQIYKGSANNKTAAINNNMPIYDTSQCEAVLRKYYNMSDTSEIIYIANKFDASMNVDNTNSYKIAAYDSVTRQPLNMDLCGDTSNTIEIPVDKNEVNMAYINQLKNKSQIDAFNQSDPAFNDYCFTYIDPQTGRDTTVNWRRQNLLQTKLPMCIGFNCTYEGINEFDYVKCNCTGFQSNVEIVNKFVDVAVKTVAELNLKVIYCYKMIPNVSFN
jgi:hypothetical protein